MTPQRNGESARRLVAAGTSAALLAVCLSGLAERPAAVGQTGRLRLEGETWQTEPGAVIRHTVTVSSSLAVADELRIQAQAGAWPVEVPATVSVVPRRKATFVVRSLVPFREVGGAAQAVTITVHSAAAGSASIRLVASSRGRLVGNRYVGCRFDFDGDGRIDRADVARVAERFNAAVGDERFDAVFDLDHSGRIGAADVQAVAGAVGSECATLPGADSTALRAAIEPSGLRHHLEALEAIAMAEGGHRAATSSGHERSAAYVADQLTAAGYDVGLDRFTVSLWEVLRPSVLQRVAPGPRTYGEGFSTFLYSGSGEVTATLQAVDLTLPPGPEINATTSGCEASDYVGFPRGSIALVQRGGCDMPTKVAHAAAAGAAAVVMFNEGQPERQGLFSGVARRDNPLPALATTFAVGEELAALLATGPVVMHLCTATGIVERPTLNVLAERPVGDPRQVILLSAHLDSVTAGPGINDNGSGVAAILEIALQMARLGITTANRLRFAFWSAEEIGLLGSEHYVQSLSREQRDAVVLVLNFDMLGSVNYVRFVYDGASISRTLGGNPLPVEIQASFTDYFRQLGLPVEPLNLGGGSDHASFVAVGIPAGGLFTGTSTIKTAAQAAVYGGEAGAPMDPCYHRACDTTANIHWGVLELLTDAAAHVALAYAQDERGILVRPYGTPAALGLWPFGERGGLAWR